MQLKRIKASLATLMLAASSFQANATVWQEIKSIRPRDIILGAAVLHLVNGLIPPFTPNESDKETVTNILNGSVNLYNPCILARLVVENVLERVIPNHPLIVNKASAFSHTLATAFLIHVGAKVCGYAIDRAQDYLKQVENNYNSNKAKKLIQ